MDVKCCCLVLIVIFDIDITDVTGAVRKVRSFSRVSMDTRLSESILWQGSVQYRAGCLDKCSTWYQTVHSNIKLYECISLSVQRDAVNNQHDCILSSVQPAGINGNSTAADILYDTYTDVSDCSTKERCGAEGVCTDTNGAIACVCEPGLDGHRCHIDIDECVSSPCIHGDCYDRLNGWECSCFRGFTGVICETNVDDCQGHNCLHGGICEDLIEEYECNCTNTGYNGTFCEIDIDPCDPQICGAHGECEILTIVNGTCHCYMPWEGELCEIQSGPPQIDNSIDMSVDNGINVGDWGNQETCTAGGVVAGHFMRIEGYTTNDWVGVSVVYLFCLSPATLESFGLITSKADWGIAGSDREHQICPPFYFVVAFRLQTTSGAGVINMEQRCRGPGMNGTDVTVVGPTIYSTDGRGSWGSWSNTCPPGSAVCAIKTRLENYRGWLADDRSLSDVQMWCCNYLYENGTDPFLFNRD